MRRQPLNQSGFIPLLITVLLIVAAVTYVIYVRVLHAKH